MGSILDFKNAVNAGIASRMAAVGENIAEQMRKNLQNAGHVDTGALLESIRSETVTEPDTVTTYIYADAQSKDGAYYAEFIELGTGAAHGRPGGRVGTWRYQDRNGVWHTTDGMDADPFIHPAVDEYIGDIADIVSDVMYDIAKYGRMVGGGS